MCCSLAAVELVKKFVHGSAAILHCYISVSKGGGEIYMHLGSVNLMSQGNGCSGSRCDLKL